VLLVHHTGKAGDSPRGSSALECAKHNNAGEQEALYFRLVPAGETCVLVEARASARATSEPLPATEQRLLATLLQTRQGRATMSELRAASGLSATTARRTMDGLAKRALVVSEGRAHSRQRRYVATAAGYAALGLPEAEDGEQSGERGSATGQPRSVTGPPRSVLPESPAGAVSQSPTPYL